MRGRVIKATGSWYNVLDDQGQVHAARIKGKMRLQERRSSNPVVIGDFVELEAGEQNGDQTITTVLPRENYIIRQGARHRTAEHIMAANLSQSVIVATFSLPRTSPGFIDRFMLTSNAYHIPVIIVLNKCDLWTAEESELAGEWRAIYEPLGCPVFTVSALQNLHLEPLREQLKGRVSVVSGHSGVGKSSLLNALYPELALKVGELSRWNKKGQHTTTFTEMFPLPGGGFLIDTPGIKEFGILDFDKAEVSHYFPEMQRLRGECRFHNCLHIQEPGCAVKAAVEKGLIHASRYNSYLGIVQELEDDERIYD